jgi:hypothetical protein
VPAPLRSLVASMLIKDREQRMSSAPLASESLRSALASSGAGAGTGAFPHASSSMSFTTTMPPITVDAPAQLQSRAMLSQLPRTWLYVGGGVLALLLVIAIWPTGSSPGEDDAGVDTSVSPEDASTTKPRVASPGALLVNPLMRPDEAVYVEIDRLLTSKQTEAALPGGHRPHVRTPVCAPARPAGRTARNRPPLRRRRTAALSAREQPCPW